MLAYEAICRESFIIPQDLHVRGLVREDVKNRNAHNHGLHLFHQLNGRSHLRPSPYPFIDYQNSSP